MHVSNIVAAGGCYCRCKEDANQPGEDHLRASEPFAATRYLRRDP
jgi:hypothetical protein